MQSDPMGICGRIDVYVATDICLFGNMCAIMVGLSDRLSNKCIYRHFYVCVPFRVAKLT